MFRPTPNPVHEPKVASSPSLNTSTTAPAQSSDRYNQKMPSPHPQLIADDDQSALTALLTRHYPRAHRMAIALCGDPALARDITREVLRQSTRWHQRWATDADAGRWFAHHTVLLSRQAIAQRRVDPAADALLPLSPGALSTVILRTVRFLPPQQREAFLLHHGEGFDLRQLATAMDCSAQAAANHLLAATEALRPVAQDRLGEFCTALPQMLARLLPPHETIAIEAARQTSRYLWPRRLKRYVGWPLLLTALIAIAYFAWRMWRMIVI